MQYQIKIINDRIDIIKNYEFFIESKLTILSQVVGELEKKVHDSNSK